MNNTEINVEQDYLPTIVNSIKLSTEEYPHVGDVVLDITSEVGKVKLKVPNWEPNTSYEKGQLIIYNNELYVVKDDFTSLDAFDKQDFETAATETIVASYSQNTLYKKGQLLIYGNKLYIVKETFTSTNFENDKSNLALVYMGENTPAVLPNLDVVTDISKTEENGIKLNIIKTNIENNNESQSSILIPNASANNGGILTSEDYEKFQSLNANAGQSVSSSSNGYMTSSQYKQFSNSILGSGISFSSIVGSTTYITINSGFQSINTQERYYNKNFYNDSSTRINKIILFPEVFRLDSNLQELGDTTIELFFYLRRSGSTAPTITDEPLYHGIVKVDSGSYNLRTLSFPSTMLSFLNNEHNNDYWWIGYKLSGGTTYPCIVSVTGLQLNFK